MRTASRPGFANPNGQCALKSLKVKGNCGDTSGRTGIFSLDERFRLGLIVSMSATCPQCGGTVFGTDTLCHECLKRVALRETSGIDENQATAVNDLLPEQAQCAPGRVRLAPVITPQAGGERYGDYELLELIGGGAMGTVYKARHVRLNRLVALKLISQGSQASESQRKRFQREAEAVARLQHPHIVTLYEAGEVDRRPFLAMEYVPGGTLGERITKTPLPPGQAAECLKKISEAVHYAHEQG